MARGRSMTPLDFIKFDGGSSPNMPVHQWEAAMSQTIKIYIGRGKEVEVLSYYYDDEDKCMVLDLGKIK
jgi:hypothetical protein